MDPVSALGLAETAFSFASALYAYVATVASAKDDIERVSGDLSATGVVLRDLGHLFEKYENSDAWKAERMVYAKACIDKAERNILKMKEMLVKTSASAAATKVERDDIDINKLQLLVFWPSRRTKLEERRLELAGTKTDILLAYMMYLAAAAPNTQAGKEAVATLPQLKRARDAEKLVRRNQKSGQPGDLDPTQNSKDAFYDAYQTDSEIVYNDYQDLLLDWQDWIRDKEVAKKKAEDEKKAIEAAAVSAWQKSQKEELDQKRKEIDAQRSKLEHELKKQRMAPHQIQQTLDKLFPLPRRDTFMALVTVQPQGDSSEPDPNLIIAKKKSKNHSFRSKLSKIGWSKKDDESESEEEIIPSTLLDPSKPSGLASLRVLLFEKFTTPTGETVVTSELGFGYQWLIDRIRATEVETTKSKLDPAWKEFARLPQEFRCAIARRLEEMHIENDWDQQWDVLHIEMLKRDKSGLLEKPRSRVQSVCVVLKERLGAPTADRERFRSRSRSRSRPQINEPGLPIYRDIYDSSDSEDVPYDIRMLSRSRERPPRDLSDGEQFKPEPRRATLRDSTNITSRARSSEMPTSAARRASNTDRSRSRNDEDIYPETIIINNRLSVPGMDEASNRMNHGSSRPDERGYEKRMRSQRSRINLEEERMQEELRKMRLEDEMERKERTFQEELRRKIIAEAIEREERAAMESSMGNQAARDRRRSRLRGENKFHGDLDPTRDNNRRRERRRSYRHDSYDNYIPRRNSRQDSYNPYVRKPAGPPSPEQLIIPGLPNPNIYTHPYGRSRERSRSRSRSRSRERPEQYLEERRQPPFLGEYPGTRLVIPPIRQVQFADPPRPVRRSSSSGSQTERQRAGYPPIPPRPRKSYTLDDIVEVMEDLDDGNLSSSSDDEARITSPVDVPIESDLSDVEITRQLLARFNNQGGSGGAGDGSVTVNGNTNTNTSDNNNRQTSTTSMTSMLGGDFHQEPKSTLDGDSDKSSKR